MNIQQQCSVCNSHTDVYIEVGYIREDWDGTLYLIPEDRLPVWNYMSARAYNSFDTLWNEFNDCRIDDFNDCKVMMP